MKYPGQPKSPPSWYRDRGQSYIEKEFSKELDDLASAIESEHWFGDQEKDGRFRVDFILKDARLIVELDGHEYHSTKEQLEKDAIRQRYLSRAGYCAKAVDNEQARLDKLMESNGIDEVPDYTDPITFNAKISSPQVGQFVGLVRKLDALMISIDTLWLSSVLSNKQRVDGNSALSNLHDALLISKFEHENQPKLRVKKQKLSKQCLQPMTISLKRKQIPPPTSQRFPSTSPSRRGFFNSDSIPKLSVTSQV